MAGYCTPVLYFHSSAARENTDAHSVQYPVISVPSQPSYNIYLWIEYVLLYIRFKLALSLYNRLHPKWKENIQ